MFDRATRCDQFRIRIGQWHPIRQQDAAGRDVIHQDHGQDVGMTQEIVQEELVKIAKGFIVRSQEGDGRIAGFVHVGQARRGIESY
ncbi:hypothetical protein ACA910_015757 [Epithemia clementina (nom. ined.)]